MGLDLRKLLRSGTDDQKRDFTKGVDELFKAAQDDRKAYEPQWLTNMAFYASKQTVEWDEETRKLRDFRDELPWWRPAPVVNLIKPSVITQYAKIVGHKPTANVEPGSDAPESAAAARFCDTYLEWQWTRLGKDALSRKAVLLATVVGTGLGKICWDPHKGDTLREPDELVGPDGVSVPNPKAGQPKKLQDGRPLRMGDVMTLPVSPLEFYPEPNAETLDEMRHCFHVKLRSAAYVKEKYGKDIDEESISAESVGARVVDMIDARATRTTKGIPVKEFWEKPSAEYEEGRYVVYAGETLLEAGPNPYPKLPLPFVALNFYPAIGRFWGSCTVDDMIDLQRNYNKARGQAIEIRNLMSKPQWLVPDQTLDDEYEITSAPGQRIDYTPGPNGEKPEMIQGKEVPATYFKDMEQTKQEIYEVSGQHEVSRAQGQTSTATGLQLLQDQDDSRLTPTIESYDSFIQKMEEATLVITKQFYAEPRLISVAGKDGSVEVMHFEGTSIPEEVRVRVQSSTALPRSRAARQEYVRGLWKDGLITEPKTALKLLEFGDLEGVYDDVNADIRQAERENQRMTGDQTQEQAPTPVVADDFHNHAVHISEHNKYRKSEEYEALPDEIKALFKQHVEQHATYLAMAMPVGPQVVPGIPERPGKPAAVPDITS